MFPERLIQGRKKKKKKLQFHWDLYSIHVNWLCSWTLWVIYHPERNRNDFVTSCRIYAGLHNTQSLLHSEQWYILASNIYIRFNLNSHFSSAMPLMMIEINFIMASFKGHPGSEEKQGGKKSYRGMGSKLVCQGKISMNFLLTYSDPQSSLVL